jgi:hypothetical protein
MLPVSDLFWSKALGKEAPMVETEGIPCSQIHFYQNNHSSCNQDEVEVTLDGC